jgi:RimJ/RimL family protein N-acetyltransferase
MLVGERVTLRAVRPDDVPVLEAWLADPTLWQLTRDDPVVPRSRAEAERTWQAADPAVASFAIEAGSRVVGACGLFAIDLHNRSADLGLWLGDPSARGHGYGGEVVGLLVDYGFRLRGLHRLQIETLATNAAMRALAERAGFRLAGTLREAAWVDGRFVDVRRYDLLADDPGVPRASAG